MAADADPQASDAVRILDTPRGAAERAAGLQTAVWVDGSLSCRPGRVRRWRRHAEQPELPPAAHWAWPALDEARRGAALVSEEAPPASWAGALRCAAGASAGRLVPASQLWVRGARRELRPAPQRQRQKQRQGQPKPKPKRPLQPARWPRPSPRRAPAPQLPPAPPRPVPRRPVRRPLARALAPAPGQLSPSSP